IAVMRIEFDTTVLAAVLTLLGYSVNDSIVIFDRIRENIKISKNDVTYGTIVDNSINQSLSRTVNTTITTLLALISLTLYGGNSIYGFSVALTFGSIIGTFSSNCLAAPLVADLFKLEKKTKNSEGISSKV
ncbi:MAG: protein translocase subunit SecF, partial [Candidatus Riflebacteria bacterium]|nr:protein translocase subunit SecF [Candidatus Riflebacteria bacterium]